MYGFRRKCIVAAIEAAVLLLLGMSLYYMQMRISVNNVKKDMVQETGNIKRYLSTVHETEKSVIENYDAVYQAKAEILAYMIRNKVDGSRRMSVLNEYSGLLETEHIFIINRQGRIVSQTAKTDAVFGYTRYAQLLETFRTGCASEAFNVETGGRKNRYYGAKIDESFMVVLEIPADILERKRESVSSWKAALRDINVGLNGFAFSVSKKDYTFLYYPNEDMIGRDCVHAGIEVEQLKDGSYCWMSVGSDRLYCSVIETKDAYVVCATSEEEVASSCRITVAAILFVVFIVITLTISYTAFLAKESRERLISYSRLGFFAYNRRIAMKSGLLSLAGMVCIFVISLYMQTLFMYSDYSVSCNRCVRELEETVDRYEDELEQLREEYNDIYLNKCRIAAHIIQSAPGQITRSSLKEICDALDITYIYVFDNDGAVSVTNSPYSNFKISDNPDDQSYEFRDLLKGREYVIQEAREDDTGEYMQYIGISLRNDEDMAVGFVQIGVHPEELESKNKDISSILDEASVGAGGFAFAVHKTDGTFAYYPEEKYIGAKAAEYGLADAVLKDKFNGNIRINYMSYYGASLETTDYYIYAVVPENEINSPQMPAALVSAIAALLCLITAAPVLIVQNPFAHADQWAADAEITGENVARPEESTVRWDHTFTEWKKRTAEQKVFTLFKVLTLIPVLCVIFVFFFGNQIFEENSVLYFIVNGNWERGVNIFTVTACIIIVCVVSAAIEIIQEILQLASRVVSAKGDTICKLLSSTLKYICIIAELYYCLAQLGVDTETLLASAGILSLVIGLGAKDLITDILAGLFIIFEGEFQVGDIVSIGDWTGTVLEVGMRTTKIEKEGNVKIINNGSISNVVNMTEGTNR